MTESKTKTKPLSAKRMRFKEMRKLFDEREVILVGRKTIKQKLGELKTAREGLNAEILEHEEKMRVNTEALDKVYGKLGKVLDMSDADAKG